MRLWSPALFLLLGGAALAPAEPPEGLLTKRIVYTVPGMDRVRVERDLVYREINDLKFTFDVYSPRGKAKPRPAVVLIHGGPLPADWPPPTQWGVYRSYAELLAASGFVGVVFNHRLYDVIDYDVAIADVRTIVEHLRSNAASFGIDENRIALWAFSGGGVLLSHAFEEPRPWVRGVVSFYGILDVRKSKELGFPAEVPEPLASQLAPAHLVEQGPGPFPPVLVARAGLDSPVINERVDEFVTVAHAKGVALELLTLPEGHHLFDILDDTPRTRQVIARTIAFLKESLEAR
jgi:acetyl esterase/lipase